MECKFAAILCRVITTRDSFQMTVFSIILRFDAIVSVGLTIRTIRDFSDDSTLSDPPLRIKIKRCANDKQGIPASNKKRFKEIETLSYKDNVGLRNKQSIPW